MFRFESLNHGPTINRYLTLTSTFQAQPTRWILLLASSLSKMTLNGHAARQASCALTSPDVRTKRH